MNPNTKREIQRILATVVFLVTGAGVLLNSKNPSDPTAIFLLCSGTVGTFVNWKGPKDANTP